MRKLLVVIALMLLTVILIMVFSTPRSHPINELYVFGDSLSDTGTVFRATGGLYPPNPPYFQGRYSNGRVWIEYLAEHLNLSSNRIKNFACGGATTVSDRNSLVPGLQAQVQSFSQANSKTNPDALYVLWSGANDYLQGATNPTLPVDTTAKAISTLAGIGAKKILVANLPDLGQLPATRNGANANDLSRLTEAHNLGLRRSLKQLNQQYLQLQIVTLDANSLYHQAIAQPSTYGFTNVTNACLVGTQSCGKPDQFLFWDTIHPTTTAHRILGDNAFAGLTFHG